MKSHKVYSSNLRFDIYVPIDFKDNMDIITSSETFWNVKLFNNKQCLEIYL